MVWFGICLLVLVSVNSTEMCTALMIVVLFCASVDQPGAATAAAGGGGGGGAAAAAAAGTGGTGFGKRERQNIDPGKH